MSQRTHPLKFDTLAVTFMSSQTEKPQSTSQCQPAWAWTQSRKATAHRDPANKLPDLTCESKPPTRRQVHMFCSISSTPGALSCRAHVSGFSFLQPKYSSNTLHQLDSFHSFNIELTLNPFSSQSKENLPNRLTFLKILTNLPNFPFYYEILG